MFGELVADRGGRAHLETFGGCLLGQLCPPSLLIATSVLEALFFVQHGLRSVSLSYAQQTHPVQDIEALAALDRLATRAAAGRRGPAHRALHVHGRVPARVAGARSLLADSARIAVLGGAQRLIVKTETEAHRIPTVAENLAALTAAADWAAHARRDTDLPDRHAVDFSQVLDEARTLVQAVLALSPDVGRRWCRRSRRGTLDVPYCLHADNAGLTRGAIDADGRLYWAHAGRMPVRIAAGNRATAVTSSGLLRMLNHTADRHDRAALTPSAARRASRTSTALARCATPPRRERAGPDRRGGFRPARAVGAGAARRTGRPGARRSRRGGLADRRRRGRLRPDLAHRPVPVAADEHRRQRGHDVLRSPGRRPGPGRRGPVAGASGGPTSPRRTPIRTATPRARSTGATCASSWTPWSAPRPTASRSTGFSAGSWTS